MTRDNLHVEVAILVSLLLHIGALGAWQQRATLARIPGLAQLLRSSATTAPVAKVPPTVAEPAEPKITFVEAPDKPEPEPARTFMETDNTQVTGEKPTTAKYYSDRDTVAANPANPTGKEADTPYLAGKETRVMSTVDALPGSAGSPARPPQPATPAIPPKPVTPPTPKVVEQPKDVPPVGLDVAKAQKVAMLQEPPATAPGVPATPPSPPPRPALPAVPGQPGSPALGSGRELIAHKSRSVESGTARIGIAAFNVAESPFGAYDKMIVRAVQSRWYALIEQNGLYERAGQVTLHFELLDDGTVQAMGVKENTAGEVLALFCQKAVLESAPFEPLPDKLRLLIGKDPREVNFTFYY
jgi:hypothetical protein